ncbi:MAG: protein-glutamate O-methyltransferase CheR [Thermodesulfobacteriota bacterium]|nr:protein-glutamate O-methyltransferase CheR [Thermodesulfobacteriota bacterium]
MGNSNFVKNNFGTIFINDAEFKAIRDLVYDNFGINLSAKKRSLVEGRLQRVIKAKGFASFSEYLNYVKSDATGQALGELSNRISTNHTFFFREQAHFDFFVKQALPEMVDRLKKERSKEFRMWCAGCSYGDEPYSFLIEMMEYFGVDYRNWDAGLLATDISMAALAGAKAGIYPEDRLKLVSPDRKRKYFKKVDENAWKVSDALSREIVFRRFNFMNKVFPFKKQFHIISCRNVMIYFDQKTRTELVEKFYNATVPGGYLFIGHSETLQRNNSLYEYVQPAIYRKRKT